MQNETVTDCRDDISQDQLAGAPVAKRLFECLADAAIDAFNAGAEVRKLSTEEVKDEVYGGTKKDENIRDAARRVREALAKYYLRKEKKGEVNPFRFGLPPSPREYWIEIEEVPTALRADLAPQPLQPDVPGASRPSLDDAVASYINELKPRFDDVSRYFVPVRWESRLDRDEDETRTAIRGSLRKGESYEDILEAFRDVPQAVVLSAPGGGKTTALNWLAKELADRLTAKDADPDAPVPLFASLDEWKEKDEPLQDYLARVCPGIGPHAQALSRNGRLVLLLDALNEATRPDKEDAIKDFRDKLANETPIWISCRRDDYLDLDLKLDQLIIEELTPPRVRWALKRRMRANKKLEAEGERLFWELTDPRLADALDAWLSAGGEEEDFWLPKNADVVKERIGWQQFKLWRQYVLDKHNLVRLAANPFTLEMIYVVWGEDLLRSPKGDLPRNRADIFDGFVDALLIKEKLATPNKVYGRRAQPTTSGKRLLKNFTRLSWDIQTIRIEDEEIDETDFGVLTVVAEKVALKSFKKDTDSLKNALDTTVLERRSGTNRTQTEVRFRHQLLQEYFVAQALDRKRLGGKKASELWPPDRWWERSGWEEVCVLLAGLYGDDCTEIIRWLAEAQPEIAAQCINESGAEIKDPNKLKKLLLWLRKIWLLRLTSLDREPAPEGRAAVGKALGRLRIDDGTPLGEPLDNRRGVGLKGGLPDILWGKIPGGEFLYGKHNEPEPMEPFEMARYPVTNVQWEAFVEAEDGYEDDRWWENLTNPIREREKPRGTESNHPRESVSWHEAMAFCAWLTHKLREKDRSRDIVTLPTEKQWERAARGVDGALYPWGGEKYESGYANVNEIRGEVGPHRLGRTSAVGIYPDDLWADHNSDDRLGVLDLTGNVWEWCLNEYDNPERTQPSGTESRVLRGGSWGYAPRRARASERFDYHPFDRSYDFGFRVVRSSPIAGH